MIFFDSLWLRRELCYVAGWGRSEMSCNCVGHFKPVLHLSDLSCRATPYPCVSCAGKGEYFVRSVCAYDISARMQYANATLKQAAHDCVHDGVRRRSVPEGDVPLCVLLASMVCTAYGCRGTLRVV